MALRLQVMYLWLRFSSEAARLLIREQGLDGPERLLLFIEKKVDDIYNVVRKPGGKDANGMPDREQYILVIGQENLKPVDFLFHYWCRCTFDWEATRV